MWYSHDSDKLSSHRDKYMAEPDNSLTPLSKLIQIIPKH